MRSRENRRGCGCSLNGNREDDVGQTADFEYLSLRRLLFLALESLCSLTGRV